jgi:uncharacterized protein YbgA (DUF1722 family)/uncharacterized protein YbbK (DUF523 family)
MKVKPRGKPRVGISACLTGKKVRYDATDAFDSYLNRTLGRHVEWVAICPEVECGMPVPREPMRLRGDPGNPRLIQTAAGKDLTEHLRRWTEKKLRELESEALCGFVFKAGSPCCGLKKVKVHGLNGSPPRCGSGVFARAFTRRFPLLPVAEAEGLADPAVRESFIERVFVRKRWEDLMRTGPTLRGLQDFHAAHELLIAAHDTEAAAALGRLVARANAMERRKLLERYDSVLVRALSREATPSRNARILKLFMDGLKDSLSAEERAPLRELIEDYKNGHVPLLVPIALLRHYVQRFPKPHLQRQLYLDPYPTELGLRARG